MADQPQTARRRTDNSRECSCSFTTFNNQLSTINFRADSKDSLRNTDVFCFGEKAQRFFAAFAADPALFHASERDSEIAHEPAIYPDRAGVDSLGDAMGAAQVLCPDRRRETVFDVIGVIDNFFFAVEGRDCYDWAENFLAICAACDRQTGNNGRLEEITFAATFV